MNVVNLGRWATYRSGQLEEVFILGGFTMFAPNNEKTKYSSHLRW